jgi:arginine:ornithine antiporter/lysine permease
MFIAAGLKYVLLVAVLFVPGTILYVWARREQKLQLFTSVELIVFIVTLLAGLVGVYGLLTGTITP